MNKLNLSDVTRYVEDNIGDFHSKRIKSIENLKLSQILKRKNPYLFKAKNVLTSEAIAKMEEDFKIAKRTLRTSNSNLNVIAINGCCYGINNQYDKGNYTDGNQVCKFKLSDFVSIC